MNNREEFIANELIEEAAVALEEALEKATEARNYIKLNKLYKLGDDTAHLVTQLDELKRWVRGEDA